MEDTKKILYAVNQRDTNTTLVGYLEKKSYKVQQITSSENLEQLLAKESGASNLFLDINFYEQNPDDILRILREKNYSGRIVILTGRNVNDAKKVTKEVRGEYGEECGILYAQAMKDVKKFLPNLDKTVLIVHRDDTLVQIYKFEIGQEGYKINIYVPQVFDTPEDLATKILKDKPNVVVLGRNFNLQLLDAYQILHPETFVDKHEGFDALEQIRKSSDIPVIVVDNYNGHKEEALDKGANVYIGRYTNLKDIKKWVKKLTQTG